LLVFLSLNPNPITGIETLEKAFDVISPWSVAAHGKLLQSDTNINLVSVYGPQLDAEKALFLQSLHALLVASLPPAATIIAGDFNLIIQASDKNNRNLNRRNMAAFRKFINDLQLKDLYLHGRRYTWSNEQNKATMVKLDRVLFNQECDAMFPDCILQALSSETSDHCPLLLNTDASFKPSRHFHFEDAWIKTEDFAATVESAWLSTPAQIDPFINLHHNRGQNGADTDG
jgi:hypothetical protein